MSISLQRDTEWTKGYQRKKEGQKLAMRIFELKKKKKRFICVSMSFTQHVNSFKEKTYQLHNAQGKIKCQMKNWSCRIHVVGYDVQDIWPENTGHINLLYL